MSKITQLAITQRLVNQEKEVVSEFDILHLYANLQFKIKNTIGHNFLSNKFDI